MKKYLFMLFALCAVAFTACSDDDDDSKVLPVLVLTTLMSTSMLKVERLP